MTADCFLNGIILSLYHVRTVCEDFNSQAVFVFESKMMGRSSAYAVERWLLYLGVLNSERSYVANTLAIVDDGDDSTGRKSSDFKQYEKAIAVTDTYHETRTRFAWVGEIKDKRLQEGLEKLSDEELRLITLYFRDEYSTVELSKVYGIAQQNISKRILKITKFLKKFGFLGVD